MNSVMKALEIISGVQSILENSRKEGKHISSLTNDFRGLFECLSYAPEMVIEILVEDGYVKSDGVELIRKESWGLKANLLSYSREFYSFSKVKKIISKLKIKPKFVYIHENTVDLIFQPNKKINLRTKDDYISLVYSFLDYIKECGRDDIIFIGWNLENINMIEGIFNKKSNIKFSKELFDNKPCFIINDEKSEDDNELIEL